LGALLTALALAIGLLTAPTAFAAPADKPAAPPMPPVLDASHLPKGGQNTDTVPAGTVGKAGGKVKLATARGGAVGGQQSAQLSAAGTTSIQAAAASTQALILYDTTGQWGWLGQTYATMAANLASQFGAWTAKPVSTYTAGEVNSYTATIYIGSTYDEPLPAAFLDDVTTTTRPVVWLYDNIWQLTSRHPEFQTTYGWMWSQFDFAPVNGVTYKSTSLTRDPTNGSGIMNYAAVGSTVQTVATAMRADGTSFPWALRSRNLTYVGEIPFAYFKESDRLIAFEDMLFDALDPGRPTRHRALVRLEDIGPDSDPAELRQIADYLARKRVPFSFGVSPRFLDPLGAYNNGTPQNVTLAQRPAVVDAIRYMQSKGGVMLEHGWTHQYSNIINPYSGASGDDFEFFRVTENADHTLNFVGPVPEDSAAWAGSRITGAANDFAAAGLATPTIFEFPHYFGSATDYRQVATSFSTRYERSLYYLGTLNGGAVDNTRYTGQMFPYPVRDVYGTKVLPENLGNVEPEDWFQYPKRLPAQIVDDAKRNLVVRDGFASFYFHPFFNIQYLRQTVEGIQAAGYTFVSPTTL
jgi:uncharacterized protein YdaL